MVSLFIGGGSHEGNTRGTYRPPIQLEVGAVPPPFQSHTMPMLIIIARVYRIWCLKLHKINIVYTVFLLPCSGKLLREKTFTNFVDLEPSFLHKISGVLYPPRIDFSIP